MSKLPDHVRRSIERAREEARHGMQLNDGKERLTLPGGTLDYLLRALDDQDAIYRTIDGEEYGTDQWWFSELTAMIAHQGPITNDMKRASVVARKFINAVLSAAPPAPALSDEQIATMETDAFDLRHPIGEQRDHITQYYTDRNRGGWASYEQQEPMPTVAWMVDGRVEQGLSFDKAAAEVMAEMNCGTVVPLVSAEQAQSRIKNLEAALVNTDDMNDLVLAGLAKLGEEEAVALLEEMEDTHVRTDKTYAVGDVPWLYPHRMEPPRGVDLFLLQRGGMAIRGQWRDDGSFIAWQYFFKRDKEAEAEAAQLKG